MQFTPWTLMIDLGLIGFLILVGMVLRAKIKFIQALFLPAGLLAGFLGLAFGPNGLGILPFSSNIGTYPSILIAMVFATLPLVSPSTPFKQVVDRVGSIWSYSQSGMLMQWGLGAAFGTFVLCKIWPNLNPAFGVMLASGFSGGHGTAAAIGATFAGGGWEEAKSLAMTSATVGIMSAVIGGIILIKIGTKKKQTNYIADFKELPESLRTGVVPENERPSMGTEVTSPMSLDPLASQFIIIFLITLGGWYFAEGVSAFFPKVSLPVFSCAFIVGCIFKKILNMVHAGNIIERSVMGRISGTLTDLLVAFGVSSISLPVVINNAVPLALLFCFGIILCLINFYFFGPRMLQTKWFERAIFTWGWMTGTMAMAIALLRVADPKLESGSLEDFAFAYMPIAPVEIILVTMAPMLFLSGRGMYFIGGCVGIGVVIWIFAMMKGWFKLKKANNA